jgi:hypothetical protein
MGEYIPAAPVNDEVRKRNQNLPGMGGIFNYVNLHVYHYAGNNPVKYTDPDGEKFEFVEGSTEVFKEDIQKMIDYLGDNETIKALIERPETVYLAENKNNEMYFDRKTNTIYMDTHSGVRPVSDDGIKIMENQIQSPALGFLHESGHALQKILHPIKFFIDLIRRDRNYRNAEERRVIENVETPTARKLGEPIRTNNKGVEVQVPSPTYSENGAM